MSLNFIGEEELHVETDAERYARRHRIKAYRTAVHAFFEANKKGGPGMSGKELAQTIIQIKEGKND